MPQQKRAWMRAAVPAAVLALALTACGSDDDSKDADDANAAQTEGASQGNEQPEEPAEEPSEEPSEEPTDDAGEGAPGGVEAVAAGSYEYQVGETSDPVPFEESGTTSVLEITADRVEVGKHADIDGILSDPSQGEGMVPAHIYTTISNVGDKTLEFTHPGNDANVINADGSYGTPLILFGTEIPGGCSDEEDDSVDLAAGDTVQQCTTVLIPEASEPAQVYWSESGGEHELLWAL